MNGLLRWSLAGKLRAAFALAFLLLPAIGVLSYWTTLRHAEQVGWVTHTYQVIVRLESVLSLLKDIESGARGYVITGEESYLEPYRTGLLSLGQERGDIRRLLRESPAQLRRLDVLEAALVERLAVAEDLVDRRTRDGFGPAAERMRTDRGRRVVERIRGLVQEMEQHESTLLSERQAAVDESARHTLGILAGGGLLAFAIGAFAVTVIGRTVAARERAEAARREESAFRQAILDSANFSIISTTPEGLITTFNRAAEEWLQYRADEVVGRMTPESFHDREEVARRALVLSLELGVPVAPGFDTLVVRARLGCSDEQEWTYIRKDGSRFTVRLSVTALRDGEGRITGFLGIGADITEHRRGEAELRKAKDAAEAATQAKNAFLASMSHEIRTPMNAIIGMADLLAESPLTEEQREYVRIFRHAGDHLLVLLNDLLDLSKIEGGHLELERIEFDLVETVRRAVEIMTLSAHTKGLDLTCRIDPSVRSRVVGDPGRLCQVLVNLLGNAVKFTERGDVLLTIEPSVAPAAGRSPRLRFAVRDSGIGIPAEKLGLIFERFTQVDASTTRKYGGSGLGLTISKRLVELMGGRVWVESEMGRGSTFSFEVPLSVARGDAAPDAPPVVEGSRAPALPLRLLLVEDSADNQALVRAYLKRTACRIDLAENGRAAVEKFRQGRYDLVLMDVQMPVMDGYEATRVIRAWEREQGRRATPIIALTANALREEAQHSLEAGCDAHLVKPVSKATLLAAIAEYTESAVS